MEPRLTLYHREGCGLCDQMLAELSDLKSRYTFALEIVDIDEDPELRERFNVLVPVLAVDDDILCCHFLDRSALLDELASA
ncbi:MAG: glutaredoxin family protein [Pseudomonadota bacterium]